MFTGIVQIKAQVIEVQERKDFLHIRVSVPQSFSENLQLGASVACNGVCLTVVEVEQQCETTAILHFDVIDETLRLTNLGELNQGSWLNLERSMRYGDEVGGHIVSGHIHDQATLKDVVKTQDNYQMTFSFAPQWRPYILRKGFIAVNGASLTLGNVAEDTFDLHLIPETLERTNLESFKIGDKANIEIDQQTMTIVDTIERIMAEKKLT
ncbi:riboflavin synthase subunit alpha [Thalassotalea sp. PS06]|uniref:riboflavin synthase subunit alpha n=1 Tax=Thalassotalea sp. PS06 TaxID=2594005 RepID=UPI001165605C|nr:riboflavin synthase subunit alpha [Thalassotalea sp. PS06]QDP01440.1 riboflavin synthase subunit alpha [Thalassotalea sp. PS06]